MWNRRDPNMKIDYAGPESGLGAKWSWESKTEGSGEMEFTQAEQNKLLGYRLTFKDFNSTSTGMLKLEPEGAATKVTWSFAGDAGNNPMMRYMGLMMDGMIGKDFDAGLANLKALAEKNSIAPAGNRHAVRGVACLKVKYPCASRGNRFCKLLFSLGPYPEK